MEYVYTRILLLIDEVKFCCEQNHVVFGNSMFYIDKREVFKIRFTRFNGNSFEAFQHCDMIVLCRGAISVGDGLTLLLKNDAKLISEPGPAI
jgi:hypothetical protein